MKDSEQTIYSALEVAKLYYYTGLTTERIARELSISRPKVSRLLSYAKQTGLVQITIHDSDRALEPLSRQISELFDLDAVHIVSVPEVLGEVLWLERVAKFTANYLNSVLEPGMTMGLAWGTTLSEVSEHLVPKDVPDLSLVQLNGSGNTYTFDNSYAAHILHNFAENYNARVYLFPVPTFFDYAQTKEAMWRERSIQRIVEMQQRADVLLYSIGAVSAGVPSHVHSGGYLEKKDVQELKRQAVVGDMATVFYRADGSYRDISINARASGPPLELYRSVDRAICVVSGKGKVTGLHAALRSGYVKTLIIDQPTARHLVAHIEGVDAAR